MKVHLLASEPHYLEHLVAIWKHLPERLRGDRMFGQQARPDKRWDAGDVVMVAAFGDIWRVRNHRIIYVEHGAGQSYRGISDEVAAHYHGGQHPEHVIGYIGPRQSVVDAWGRPGFAAGSPVCDDYELFSEEQVAAITFHWNARRVCPEATTAFEHYIDRLPEIVASLRRNGWEVLGHRHPRFDHMSSAWRNLDVREANVDEVRRRAQVLIADNTSLMYEMLYLGRAVVALNAPWFRRDVDHGLRFWDLCPPRQVDDADGLLKLIAAEFPDPFGDMTERELAITAQVYGQPLSRGHDGIRAATWVTTLVAGLTGST